MINKVILVGNVGAKPEIKGLDHGKQVATFSIATSKKYNDKNGEKQTQTQWHNCIVWKENLVPIIEKYVDKGTKLYIEGEINYKSYKDKDDVKRYFTEIIVHIIHLLGNKQENSVNQQSEPETKHAGDNNPELDNDDLPF